MNNEDDSMPPDSRSNPPVARRRAGIAGLLVLNAALLLVLAAVTFSAQATAQQRARGKYTMVAGMVNGADSGVVYIADVTNQKLLALTFDPTANELRGIASADLAADAVRVSRRR